MKITIVSLGTYTEEQMTKLLTGSKEPKRFLSEYDHPNISALTPEETLKRIATIDISRVCAQHNNIVVDGNTLTSDVKFIGPYSASAEEVYEKDHGKFALRMVGDEIMTIDFVSNE